MLNSILVGLLLAMLTIVIHAVGTTSWIWRLSHYSSTKRRSRVNRFFTQMRVLCSTAAILLGLHIVEVVIWATAYHQILGIVPPETFEEAIYFSTVTFSSLGYGDVVIVGPWRLLSAIQAMTGLLVFGWSSALLFTIVQKIWETSAAGKSQAENSTTD